MSANVNESVKHRFPVLGDTLLVLGSVFVGAKTASALGRRKADGRLCGVQVEEELILAQQEHHRLVQGSREEDLGQTKNILFCTLRIIVYYYSNFHFLIFIKIFYD
jgi:hypothetical protein